MPDDQELLDKIDAFLQGRLPAEEQATFEAEIRADPALAEKVAAQRVVLDAVKRMFVLQMKDKARQWRTEAPTSPGFRAPGLLIALFAVLLLVGAFWLWKSQQPAEKMPNPMLDHSLSPAAADSLLRLQKIQEAENKRRDSLEQTAKKYVKAPPERRVYAALARREWDRHAADFNANIRKADPATVPNVLDQAAAAINNRQYDRAQNLLESVGPENKALFPRSLDMRAHVYAQRGKTAQAIAAYKQYIAVSNSNDKELLDWTLLHYYLADYPRYRSNVQRLLRPMLEQADHDFHDRASDLQMALEQAGLW